MTVPGGPLVGILAAAGTGERLGAAGPKALVPCGGRPLLEWSLEVLDVVCDRVVIAVPSGHEHGSNRVAGGASRSESVANAVRSAPKAEVYVVHDAARPLVTQELIQRCLEGLERGVDGAVAAVAMTDTVKEAGPDGRVIRTLDRGSLWAIQTPQAFRGEALRRALDVDSNLLAAASDDASLVEAAGGAVSVVEGSADNLKVTSSIDLATVEAVLRERATVR